jgi:hypothetical protein
VSAVRTNFSLRDLLLAPTQTEPQAPVTKMAEDASFPSWICATCTLDNVEAAKECTACGAERPKLILHPEDKITLGGLKAEMYNGKHGTLLRFCYDSGRWEVKLDGKVALVKVKPCHITLNLSDVKPFQPGPSGKSPQASLAKTGEETRKSGNENVAPRTKPSKLVKPHRSTVKPRAKPSKLAKEGRSTVKRNEPQYCKQCTRKRTKGGCSRCRPQRFTLRRRCARQRHNLKAHEVAFKEWLITQGFEVDSARDYAWSMQYYFPGSKRDDCSEKMRKTAKSLLPWIERYTKRPQFFKAAAAVSITKAASSKNVASTKAVKRAAEPVRNVKVPRAKKAKQGSQTR